MTNNETLKGFIGKGQVRHIVVSVDEDGTAHTACGKAGKLTVSDAVSCMPCRKEYRAR